MANICSSLERRDHLREPLVIDSFPLKVANSLAHDLARPFGVKMVHVSISCYSITRQITLFDISSLRLKPLSEHFDGVQSHSVLNCCSRLSAPTHVLKGARMNSGSVREPCMPRNEDAHARPA
jgi:hypothetical protein